MEGALIFNKSGCEQAEEGGSYRGNIGNRVQIDINIDIINVIIVSLRDSDLWILALLEWWCILLFTIECFLLTVSYLRTVIITMHKSNNIGEYLNNIVVLIM